MIPFIKTIGFRLWLACSAAIITPLGVNIFLLAKSRYQKTVAAAATILEEDSAFKVSTIAKVIPLSKNALSFLSDALDLDEQFPSSPDLSLSQEMRYLFQEVYSELSLVKIDNETPNLLSGSIIASTQTEKIGKRQTLKTSLKEPFQISIKYSEADKAIIISSASNVYNKISKKLEGALLTTYSAEKFFQDLLVSQQENFIIQTAVITHDGLIIKASDPKLFLQQLKTSTPEKIDRKHLTIDTLKIGSSFIKFYHNDQEMWGFIEEVPELDIALLSYSPKSQLLKPLKLKILLYCAYLLFIFLGSFFAYGVAKILSYPIRKLATVMTRTRHVEDTLPYKEVKFGFEINRLGAIFNDLLHNLSTQQKLAEKNFRKKESAQQELQLGEQAQRSLLPTKVPSYPGITTAYNFSPAITVGGDFFDVFVKGEGDLAQFFVVIADASGKGVNACGHSLFLKNMLKTFLMELSSIEDAVKKTAEGFFPFTQETGMFVTLCIYRYSYASGTIDYYSCGHNPGYYASPEGKITTLSHPGMALGFVPNVPIFPVSTLKPQKGSVIALYSDGVTEAHNNKEHLFGEQRLQQCLKQYYKLSAKELSSAILTEVKNFAEDQPQHDDITLFIFKFL
ncbi:PP2C family protein-serine/threonine phosphatase [Chlamydiifrater phoenicopteri]|uniref:PP2C family protein-serine/threonine phosphatase n=1 Tax=Chlamydiifrater phoenicopteri TaxID=2681469 RepID=UPI001BCD56F7|nr:PP2C family protein-serine/threonine phosphatase [Chlamydiifrater phoenicopteri]